MRVTPVDDIDVIVDDDNDEEDPEVDAAAADNKDDDDEVKTEDEVVQRVLLLLLLLLLGGGWDTSDDTDSPPAGIPPTVSDDGTDTAEASEGSLDGREERFTPKGWGCGWGRECTWGWGYSPSGGFTSPNDAPTGSEGRPGLPRPSGKRPPAPIPNPTGFESCEAGAGVTTGAALQELVVVVVVVMVAVAGRARGCGRPTRGDWARGSGLM